MRLSRFFRFWLERQLVRGVPFQLLIVAAAIGLLAVVGGLLVMPTGEPLNEPDNAIWWAFLRMTDPGYLGDDTGAWRRIVSTGLTLCGYVLFLGALVAVMTQWLNSTIRKLESGRTPVAAQGHVVILGWTNRTVPIVQQLLLSEGRVSRFLQRHHRKNLQVVVLSEEVTAARSYELSSQLRAGSRVRDVILRSGSPIQPDHLQRVDFLNAAAVLVPSQRSSSAQQLSPDARTIKILLSLSSHPGARDRPESLPFVVAELRDLQKLTVARRAYRGPLEIIAGDAVISRLLGQNVRHPGLSVVYHELLARPDGTTLYIRQHPDLDGADFAAATGRFPQAVLLGAVRKNAGGVPEPILNPPDDFLLQAEDRLVFLTDEYSHTDLSSPSPDAPARAAAAAPTPREPAMARPLRVLILGWNDRIPALIHELGTYTDASFEIQAVSMIPRAQRERAVENLHPDLSRLRIDYELCDYLIESELARLNPLSFDRIILASSKRFDSGEEADARTIAGFLLLEELFQSVERPPQRIIELIDPDNHPLFARSQGEVIISPLILSNLMAQIALRRELRFVFEALFSAGGPEILFREPAAYGLEGAQVPFGRIQERAREHGETALGVLQNVDRPTERRLRLNPDRSEICLLRPEDRLVVMISH